MKNYILGIILFTITLCFFSIEVSAQDNTAEIEVVDSENSVLSDFCGETSNSESLASEVCKAFLSADKRCKLPTMTVAECKTALQGNDFLKTATKHLKELLLALMGLVTAFLLAWIGRMRGKVSELTDSLFKFKIRLGDPIVERIADTNVTTGVNVVIYGIGGTGKTSIIRALTGMRQADPESSTDKLATYSIVQEHDYKEQSKPSVRSLTRIYLEDSIGQNISVRVNDSTVEKREAAIPSTVLVLVVDLFGIQQRDKISLKPSMSRIKDHYSEFNKTTLQSIRGSIKHISSVVLFINKFDLLKSFSKDEQEQIIKKFEKLSDSIKNIIPHKKYYVIAGAATKGLGVVGYNEHSPANEKTLLEVIMDDAVEIDLEAMSNL